MPRKPYQLFVWEDVLCDYTCGLAVAVARSKEEAIEALSQGDDGLPPRCWGLEEIRSTEPTVHPLNTPFGVYVHGGG